MLTAFSSWKGYTVFEAHTARPHSNHRWLYPFMERKADAVVCLTKGDAMNYPKARRVEVIPNFTDVVNMDSPKSSSSQNSCLFVGRLSPQKDPLRLLCMWKDIVAKHRNWVLDIYGTGELEERVRAEIARLGIDNSVKMHGYTKDMAQVYAGAEMLLLCSHTEGLPMVVMEAMRYGLPVVSTDCQYGPADMIENGKNGFLVPQNDDEAFVNAVSALMGDEALRKRMGERARKTSARYSREAIVERWKKMFLEL
jgi:glycosyltransferase involved in cell wall biosynthesis